MRFSASDLTQKTHLPTRGELGAVLASVWDLSDYENKQQNSQVETPDYRSIQLNLSKCRKQPAQPRVKTDPQGTDHTAEKLAKAQILKDSNLNLHVKEF